MHYKILHILFGRLLLRFFKFRRMANDSVVGYLELDDNIKKVTKFLSILIVVVGTTGNALTLHVMTSRQFQKSSFTVYLISLAFVDIIVLWVWPFKYWLFGIDIEGWNTVVCKLITLVTYCGRYTTSWLVVALTVERFFCTYFPIKMKTICCTKTGFIVVSVLLFVLVLINSHILYGFSSVEAYGNETICGIEDGGYETFFNSYFSWIDNIVLFLLPAVLIISCNVATVTRLMRTGENLNSNVTETNKARKRQAMIITLIVSTAFVLLVGPLGVYVVLWPFVFSESADLYRDQFGSKEDMIVYTVVSTLEQVNHCINFFMYFLSGPRFRRDLKVAVCGSRTQLYGPPVSHSKASTSNQ